MSEMGFNSEAFIPSNNSESSPNLSNQSKAGAEKEGSFNQSVARSKTVKQAAGFIIHTRQQLVDFLAKQNIKLLTSALEYQQTGDFVTSSYVVFSKFKNHQETLVEFLARYPQIVASVNQINEQLKKANTQSYLNVKRNSNQNQNPFANFMN